MQQRRIHWKRNRLFFRTGSREIGTTNVHSRSYSIRTAPKSQGVVYFGNISICASFAKENAPNSKLLERGQPKRMRKRGVNDSPDPRNMLIFGISKGGRVLTAGELSFMHSPMVGSSHY